MNTEPSKTGRLLLFFTILSMGVSFAWLYRGATSAAAARLVNQLQCKRRNLIPGSCPGLNCGERVNA